MVHDDQTVLLQGLATPHERPMCDVRDGWRVLFAEGTFGESLRQYPCALLVNHDTALVLAAPGTFTVFEVEAGVFFSALIPRSRWRWALQQVQTTTIQGCSVSWRDEVEASRAHGIQRVCRARLVEVSVMVGERPAFAETWCTVIE